MANKVFIPKLTDDKTSFPNPLLADDKGLLAWGGCLSEERVLNAYLQGIFPWYNQSDPILWWSPNPRAVLYPAEIKISKSLKKNIKKYTLCFDKNFKDVIAFCQNNPKRKAQGTWIHQEIVDVFCSLHVKGLAHSVECYEEDILVGGLYGLYLGGVFCGESMFSLKTDASKVALLGLCEKIQSIGGDFIDCQMPTKHLSSLGAVSVEREDFIEALQVSLKKGLHVALW